MCKGRAQAFVPSVDPQGTADPEPAEGRRGSGQQYERKVA